MNSTIDQKIEDSIVQINFFLRKLPFKQVDLNGYVFPNISITDMKDIDGIKYATVDIDVAKDPVLYKQGDEHKRFETVQEYWNWAVKKQLKKPGLTYTTKAASLLELRQNIIHNFSDKHKQTVDSLTGVIDEAIEDLKKTKEQEKEPDIYHVPMHSLKDLDPQLNGAYSIRIAGMVSEMIFNPENYEVLNQLNKGKTSCNFKFTKQIIYE
jgi:hypothetical protein